MKSSISYLIRKLGFPNSCNKIAIGALAAMMFSYNSYAQEYAVSQTSSVVQGRLPITNILVAPASVTNGANAVGSTSGNLATMSASGIVVTLISYTSNATLNLTMGTPVPAAKTSYVKITEPSVSGITLDLGNLANLLGLLANNTIAVTTNAGTASSTFVKDGANNLYLAVTSTEAYSTISIKLDFANSVGLLGVGLGSISMGVDYVVTYENSPIAPCEADDIAFAGLDPDAAGIALTLTQALQDPERAIDGIITPTNYSLLQNGTVAAVSTVSQTIFLGKTALGTNEIVATISKPAALLNLGVLENVTFQAYMGETPVGPLRNVEDLLADLDLLGLFGNDSLVTVAFSPGVPHDRVVATSRTVLNANLFTGLRIHELGSRPPVIFDGGILTAGREKDPLSVNLNVAVAGVGEPGFGIQCGVQGDYTYELLNVANARTMGGTLPATLTLSTSGVLSGTPVVDDAGLYTFDVIATNKFGQADSAQFQIQIDPALPVTLVNFNAVSEGSTASLSWSTSEEVNSDRFDIERSQNGKNWAKIGSVASNHESKIERYYSFADAAPLKGANLYRLKMVDFDGTFAYSHIENLHFNATSLVYPNPVASTENLTVNVADWSKVKVVKVVSASGKVVFEASNALLSGISAKNLVAGAYVVQVTLTDGTTSTQR